MDDGWAAPGAPKGRGLAGQKPSKDVKKDAKPSSLKKKRRTADVTAAEASLSAAVFGENAEASSEVLEDTAERGASAAPEAAAWHDADDETFRVDIRAHARLKKLRKTEKDKSAAGDDFENRLRERFAAGRAGSSAWADPVVRRQKTRGDEEGSSEDETESGFLRQTSGSSKAVVESEGGGKGGHGGVLGSQRVSVERCADANVCEPSKSVVQCVDFASDSELMLCAGLDKTLRLFRVDGEQNAKQAAVHVRDMPIHAAKFADGGRSAVLSGRRPFFYTYDVAAGRATKVARAPGREDKSLEKFAASPDGAMLAFTADNGRVSLCDARRGVWAADDLKMSGSARCVAFSHDSTTLLTAGGDADVYVWDLRLTARCVERFRDAGSSTTSSLCCAQFPKSGAAQHRTASLVCVGSEAGVVSAYARPDAGFEPSATFFSAPPAPAPLRAIMSLTTSIDSLAVSHDSQILAIASKWSKDALRLVHVPSCHVFSNWPTSSTPLHYVSAVAFSRKSNYLAVGNDRGRVLLYRLNHYA